MSPNLEMPQNNMRERVDKLRETDNPEEDSVWDLAHKEKEMREKLKKRGMPKENIGEMADEISDIELEKIEAQKETTKEKEDRIKAEEKFEIAEKNSLEDPLTGLGSRRALLKEGIEFLSFAKRHGGNCSFIMLDMDHFKKVNDSFGHPIGDKVLRVLAKIIRENIRKEDAPYRYGGEEFIIILPDVDSDLALRVAEKIRNKVEEEVIKFEHNGENKSIQRTISIGISGTNQLEDWDDGSLDELMKMADDALYSSKANGRNRTTVYDPKMKEEKKAA